MQTGAIANLNAGSVGRFPGSTRDSASLSGYKPDVQIAAAGLLSIDSRSGGMLPPGKFQRTSLSGWKPNLRTGFTAVSVLNYPA
jgi:hypothetical protein